MVTTFTTVTNISSQNDLLTQRNKKALDKAIEKNFDQPPGETWETTRTGNEDKEICIVKIVSEEKNKPAGWGVIAKAKGRREYFDFMVLFNKQKEIKHIEIIKYRSSHGYQITSKRWLRDFKGLTAAEPIQIGDHVDGISGATLSSHGLVKALNKILPLIDKF